VGTSVSSERFVVPLSGAVDYHVRGR